MERKRIKPMSHFVLSQEEKVALIEAKIARTEEYIRSLAALAEKQATARGAKYPSRWQVVGGHEGNWYIFWPDYLW